MLAIKTGKRIPDGLLLVYPGKFLERDDLTLDDSLALNLDPKHFTPSYLLALDEPILNYTFLKLCVVSYIPEGADPEKDPFLSPILASPEVK